MEKGSDDKEKQIERKYTTNKNIVHQWEATIVKTQGRQPGKDDLKQAPKHVKDAYARYFKYRKQLIKLKSETERKQRKRAGQGTSTTPQKIFKAISCVSTSSQNRNEIQDSKSSTPSASTPNTCKKAAYLANLSGKFSMQHKRLRLSAKFSKLSDSQAESEIDESKQSHSPLETKKASPGNGSSNPLKRSPGSSTSATNNSVESGDGYETIDDQDSMESFCKSINFDTEEEEDKIAVPSQLYSNFLEGYNDSMISNFDHSINDSSPLSSTTNQKYPSKSYPVGNELNSTSITKGFTDDDSKAEEVQNCRSTLSEGINKANGISLFPISSFVLSSLNASDADVELTEPSKNVGMNSGHESSTLSQDSEPYFPAIAALGPTSSSFASQTSLSASYISDKNNKENQVADPKPTSPVKRKFTYAFSPSPEKEQPKKKFFKSDRKINTRQSQNLASCLPEIPDEKLDDTSGRKRAPSSSSVTLTLLEIPSKVKTPIQNVTKKSKRMVIDSDSESNNEVMEDSKILSSSASEQKSRLKEAPAKVKRKTVTKRTGKIVGAAETRRTSTRGQKSDNERSAMFDNFDPNGPALTPVIDAFDIVQKGGSTRSGKRVGGMRSRPANARRTRELNENFVSIDITKKVFVRGKKTVTGAKVKRADWKKKKTLAARECKLKSLTCRKCGDLGHFARFCRKGEADVIDDPENDLVDDSPWPTLEEAARMVWSKAAADSQYSRTEVFDKKQVDEDETDIHEMEAKIQGKDVEVPCSTSSVPVAPSSLFTVVNPYIKRLQPYFSEDNGIDTEERLDEDIKKGLQIFGYDDFRSGQREAIVRVLKGESTLLMLSTGSGKSLCYQLPAYMYAKKYPGALTICVSPLISLMEDQVEGMPGFLNAAFIHYNMTEKRKTNVIESIKKGKVNILLVSAEAVCGGLFGLLRDVSQLPPIAFACIDEVHCVSEWSHNFRPSYLQVCKLLREKLNVKTILGLTATATTQTCTSICEQLQIHPSTVIRGELIPKNLNLSVSRDDERDVALVQLLMGDRFVNAESIIIYCTRREECNRVAELIRTHVKVPKFDSIAPAKFRTRVSTNCEAYHAGLTGFRRNTIQKQFMQGKIRIVVATIAFGMGIDKSDIRSVIHYNMPQTFESYVQEIGRAGRDGLEANCHLFLDNIKGRDLSELKRHVFANSIDRVTVRKLIKRIFKPCKCKRTDKSSTSDVASTSRSGRCPGHEVSFNLNETIQDLDIPEENIDTLLCYLENDKQRKWIEILPKTYEICRIHSYGGSKLLKSCALKCPPLAVAIALEKEKKNFADTDVYIEFNVIEAAATVGWNSAVVRRELKSLEWIGAAHNEQGKPTKFRKAGILVEFGELAFRCRAPGDLSDKEYDAVFSSLCEFNSNQERRQLYQLHKVYQSLYSVSSPKAEAVADEFNEEFSATLKEFIYEYFHQNNAGVPVGWKAPQGGLEREEDIRRETRNLILNYKDTKFTGRAVAKLFQGISSPCFLAQDWCRNRAFWRRFVDVDFHLLSKIASEEILSTAY